MTDRSHTDRNAAATASLRALAASLTEADYAVDLGGGWNVGMAFAHLAFWDAFHVVRWQAAAERGDLAPTFIGDDVTHPINEALVASWRAMPGASAVALALEAADVADQYIADLEDDAVDAARERDGANWVERFPHREDHIEQVGRALGRG